MRRQCQERKAARGQRRDRTGSGGIALGHAMRRALAHTAIRRAAAEREMGRSLAAWGGNAAKQGGKQAQPLARRERPKAEADTYYPAGGRGGIERRQRPRRSANTGRASPTATKAGLYWPQLRTSATLGRRQSLHAAWLGVVAKWPDTRSRQRQQRGKHRPWQGKPRKNADYVPTYARHFSGAYLSRSVCVRGSWRYRLRVSKVMRHAPNARDARPIQDFFEPNGLRAEWYEGRREGKSRKAAHAPEGARALYKGRDEPPPFGG